MFLAKLKRKKVINKDEKTTRTSTATVTMAKAT